jgi:transcriptional regulator with XRE-family HTH domain
MIGRLERGNGSLSVATLRKIADVTGSRLVIRLEGKETVKEGEGLALS